MKPISVYGPSSVEEAIQILSLHGTQAGAYAGGTDLLIQLKNRIDPAPSFLVDIKRIDGLRYIKEDGQGGVQIGALTKLAEVAESDLLAKRYPMLEEAMQKISSQELRNASTAGGDMLQQVWCQYLRGGYSCYRNGGYTGLMRPAIVAALTNAAPLKYNATKVDMAKGLLTSGITKLATA
jgi:xanthine dehydrogenase YagS FAD-binding subunit